MSSAYSSAVVGGKLKLKRPGAGPAAAAAPVAKPAAPVTAPPKPAAPAPPAPAKSPVPAAPESFAGTKRKADDTAVPSEVVPAAKAPRLDSDSGAGAAEAPAASAPAAKVIKVEDLGLKGLTASERAHAERMLQRKAELAKKDALKTHRERVADMNASLAKLPEHNDLFRISYAGTG